MHTHGWSSRRPTDGAVVAGTAAAVGGAAAATVVGLDLGYEVVHQHSSQCPWICLCSRHLHDRVHMLVSLVPVARQVALVKKLAPVGAWSWQRLRWCWWYTWLGGPDDSPLVRRPPKRAENVADGIREVDIGIKAPAF